MIQPYSKQQRPHFSTLVLAFVFTLCGFSTLAQTVDCSDAANCSDPYCNYAANIEKGCNCFDGTDNDLDGTIDKADPNCAAYYGLIFVGEGSDCSILPPGINDPFDLVDDPIMTAQNTADTQSKISVGDVDGDGIPDAVITSKWNSNIRVIATSDGQADGIAAGKEKSSFKIGKQDLDGSGGCNPQNIVFEHENLIADIDGDGKAELFGVVSNRAGNPKSKPTCFYLVGFRYAPGTLVMLWDPVVIGPDRPGTFGIADMDGDGLAEVYMRDRIYAAETGALIASGGGDWDLDITAGPVAVNVSGDTRMELVAGTKIFSIPSLANRTAGSPAALTLIHDMNTVVPGVKAFVKLADDPVEYGKDTHSMTSVADMDRDGNIDVVISGALNSPTGRTAVFYWNVVKNTVSYALTPSSDDLGYTSGDYYDNYLTGWIWGTGRVNLGDANGDGNMDLSFIAGSQLFCLTVDATGTGLVTLWTQNMTDVPDSPIDSMGYREINDSRSGVLTVSIYDFNNDGNPEMAYRDSQELVVIDGATGTVRQWDSPCQSHTYTEGPIIADVNGDGATDVCVPCATAKFDIMDDIQQQALGQFRLYYSSGNEWLPTRKVWNQPGYFVVNINDDLTLPFPQFDQNMIFGTSDCPNGIPGPQQPLNMFLNQVPYLSAGGCPVFPAPDLSYTGDDPDADSVDTDGDGIFLPAVEVVPPVCGDLDIKARFHIINDGDLPITADIPVTFWHGDPTAPDATADSLLFSTTINIANLAVDSTLTTDWVTFTGSGGTFRLYIVLNNDGSVLPIDPSASSPTECRIDNNISSILVAPDPFETKIEKIADNFKCSDFDENGNPIPNVGELQVKVFKNGVEQMDISPYAFQWFTGPATAATAIPGATNYNITGLAEGDYSVQVTNTLKGCVGTMVDTTVLRLGALPVVHVDTLASQRICNPPDGGLEAIVEGGNTGVTFQWFDEAFTDLGIVTHTATNLKAGTYTLIATKNGCSASTTGKVEDKVAIPDAQAVVVQDVEDCLNPNSGKIMATAFIGPDAQDSLNYTFEWYYYDTLNNVQGSILPVAHGTGPTRYDLPVGGYQVLVTDNATQCQSLQTPIAIVRSATVIPTVTIQELAPQTSCDNNAPNGILEAVAAGTGLTNPTDFTFEWFEGDNTLAPTLTSTSGTNGEVLEQVKGGGLYYTVRVTTANNCSATEKHIITETRNVPVVALDSVNNSICDPALAATTYNGSVSATVTFGGAAVTDFTNYQFTWHDGGLTSDPVTGGNTTSISNLDGGFYTVVVERTDLACVSVPVSIEVENRTTLPVITTDFTASTNCAGGTPNGSVEVTGVAPADTYTYAWYDPDGNLMAAETADIVSGLQGGVAEDYTVEVTLNTTGCHSTFSTNVPTSEIDPIIATTTSPNSICDTSLGFNGSMSQQTLTDTNALPGDTYTYAWSTGGDMSQIIGGETASVINGLNSGSYTVTVTNDRLNCTSDPVTDVVADITIDPVIDIATTPSTNCVGGDPNGAVTASVTNNTAGHVMAFQWYDGNVVDATQAIAAVPNQGNLANAILLQGGLNYTVHVRNTITGCESAQTETLGNMSVVPVLTLDSINNSICDATLTFNGSAFEQAITDANTNGTDTYTFAWSAGTDMSSPLAGTSNTLSQLEGGFYTATATNDRLNCTSNPVTIEVRNVVVLPAISSTPTHSTNCVGGDANGEIVAGITNNTAGHPITFQWYDGSDTNGAQIPALPNNGDTDHVILLQGGQNYTVLARNTTTGCENTFTQALTDLSEAPVLTLDSVDNSICDVSKGFNGSAFQQTLTDPNTDGADTYTFAWSAATDMSNPVAGTTSTLANIEGGFYTATVTNDRLNCVSNPVTIEVRNVLVLPAISATPDPSTNCVGGAPNGSIAASITNNGAGHAMAFQWYEGIGIAGTAVPAAPNLGNTLSAVMLQGGMDYTLHVENTVTGCENTFTQTLADISEVPVLTLDSADNSICDVSKGFNGSAFQQTLTDPGTNGSDTYTFAWSAATDMSNPVAGTTGTLANIEGGFYTATVTNDRLNCTSNPVTIEVRNVLVLPAISAVPDPSTNCAPGDPNGSIAASITNNGAGHAMAFQWYEGIGTGGTAVPAAPNLGNTLNVVMLQGGLDYTLHVENTVTGCENTFTQTLADISEVPVLSLDSIDNVTCDITYGFTGEAFMQAIVDDNVDAGDTYTYAWSTGSDMSALLGDTDDRIDGKDGGFYTATVTNDRLGCTSNPVTIQVRNVLVLPDLTVTPQHATHCVGGTPNGEVTVVVNNKGTDPITYQWYNGNTVTPSAEVLATPNNGNTDHIVLLDGGANYTIHVINDRTGCESTFTQTLNDISVLPTFDVTVTNNEKCIAPFDGEIAITGGTVVDPNAFGTDEYTVKWYNGAAVVPGSEKLTVADQVVGNLPANGIYDELEGGLFYTVTLTNERTNCTSTGVTREVLDDLTPPDIALVPKGSTNCVGGIDNGEIAATVTSTILGQNFTYEWFAGNMASGVAFSTLEDITGQPGGANYTLKATTTETGCTSTATTLIPDDSEIPVITDLIFSPNENCTTPFSGEAEVDPITPFTYRGSTISAPYTGFTLTWSGGVANGADAIEQLGAGVYTLQVTADDDNCISVAESVTIVDVLDYPDVDVTITNQTSCDATAPNGKLVATETSGSGTYTFDWFAGVVAPTLADVGTGLAENGGVDGETTAVLAQDDYTVLAVNSTTRCQTTATFFLPDQIVNPSISFGTINHVTECGSPNGEAVPTVNGVSPMPNTNYTIYYVNTYSDPSNPGTPPTAKASIITTSDGNGDTETHAVAVANDGTNPPTKTGLMPGFLTAFVVDNYTTCESSVVTVQLQDQTVLNTITVGTIAEAGVCAGGGGGSIQTTVAGGAGGYTYAWYKGTPTNNNINFFTNPPNMGALPVIANIEDLLEDLTNPPVGVDAGTYTLVVTDAVGCGNYAVSSVPFADRPDITITPTDPAKCVSPFDGEIEVVLTNANFGPYSIIFYDGNNSDPATGTIIKGEITDDGGVDNDGDGAIDAADPDANALTLTATGLSAGQYVVQVIDYTASNRNCPVDQGITLVQQAYSPVVTLGDITPNTACDDTNHADGSVEITVEMDANDQRPLATPIEFELTSITPDPVNDPGTISLATGVATFNTILSYGFGPTSYTLRVTETASGCFTDQIVSIPDQPAIPQLIDVTVQADSYCAPLSNGFAEVIDVEPDDVEDYHFNWYDDATLPAPIYDEDGSAGLGMGELYNSTKAGYATGTNGQSRGKLTYYVRGERLPGGAGAGCPTPAVQVVIQDEHVAPSPTLTTIPNTSCTPGTGEGSISIATITDTGGADPAVDAGAYSYSINPDPNTVGTLAGQAGLPVSTPFTALENNTYTVTVMNEVNGCISEGDVTVTDSKFTLAITNFTSANQLICDPDGEIEVTEITIDKTLTGVANEVFPMGATPLTDDWDFQWFAADATDPNTFNPLTPLQDNPGPSDINREVLEDGTAAGQYGAMGAGTYYVIATRKAGVTVPVVGLGCETAPVQVVIDDEHVNPVVTLTPFSNTACDNSYEGEIEVGIVDGTNAAYHNGSGAFDFDYTWTSVAGATPATINPYTGVVATDGPFTGLEEGDYTLQVVNNQSGCVVSATTKVIKNTIPIFVTDFDIIPQMFCEPSGKAEVTAINYNDRNGNPAVAPVTDFVYNWSLNGAIVATTDPASPIDGLHIGTELDSIVYGGIGFGIYQLTATRFQNGPGSGCTSAPINIEIKDERRYPTITLTPFSNTSCTAAFEGEIDVNVSDESLPTGPFTYSYTWSAIPAGPTPPANLAAQNGVNNKYVGLQEGTFNVVVENELTKCTAQATTTIVKNQTPVFVQDVDVVPQFFCDPSGSGEVTLISYNDRDGVTQNGPLVDFTYEWLADDLTTSLQNSASASFDSTTFLTIEAGTYYVVATRVSGTPGDGCKSAPFRFEITDETRTPVVTLTPFSNTSCTADFEGEIRVDIADASVDKAPAVPFTFDYTWTDVNAAGLVLPNNDLNQDGVADLYTGQEDGVYRLSAVNDQTGCVGVATATIVKNQTPVFVQDVAVLPQFFCYPSGNIEVEAITYNDRNGVSQNGSLPDFTFEWLADDGTTVLANTDGSVAGGETLDSLDYATIGAGTYYVVATRDDGTPGAGCKSAPFRVEIIDETRTPVITLTPFSNTSCTAAFEGEIRVDIADASVDKVPAVPFTFDYTWTDVNAAGLVLPNNDLNQDGVADLYTGQEDGVYRLSAVNDQTGCVGVATTTIVKNQTPVFVTNVASLPQFFCAPSGNLEVMAVTYEDRNGTVQNGALTDFNFEWLEGDITNSVAITDGNAGGTALDSTIHATIGAGTYYVIAERETGVPGAGCKSAPTRVEIVDETRTPVVTLTPFSNTSCTTAFEGEIRIDVADASVDKVPFAAFNYDYVWTDVNTAGLILPTTNNTNQTGTANVYTQLSDGVYKVAVTNNVTGCVGEATTTIERNQTPVFVQNVSMVPELYCTPIGSGHLEVISINYNDRDGVTNPGPLADFTFEWMRNDLTAVVGNTDGSQPRGTFLDSLSYAGPAGTLIGAGVYYVVAERVTGVPGAGCKSAPFRIDIDDQRTTPTVAFSTIANTACDGNFDGRITVTASTDAGPGVGANYNIDWISLPAGNTIANVANNPTPYQTALTDVIGPGSFTARVTNATTLCYTDGVVTMTTTPQPLEILAVSKVDQAICYPDGDITISNMNLESPTNYTYTWFRADPSDPDSFDATAPLTDDAAFGSDVIGSATLTGSVTPADGEYSAMGAGTYYVIATKVAAPGTGSPGSGCATPPFRVDIEDLHIDPLVSIAHQPNSSCSETNPNGVLLAMAEETDGTNTDTYNFTWTYNGGALHAASLTTSVNNFTDSLYNAADGVYVVTATNTTTTGCSITKSVEIIKDLNISTPNIIDVTPNHPLDCFPTGSAEVTRISIGGVSFFNNPPDDLDTRFDFQWYKSDFTPATQIAGETGHVLPNITPDTYYVLVEDLMTFCQSTPKEVVILPDDIVYPVVTINQTSRQIGCPSHIGTGELVALADGFGDSNTDYTFEWFNNLDVTPPPVGNSNVLSNLIAGEYSVLATNLVTGCSETELYIIQNEAADYFPKLSLTTEDRINCLTPDGILLVREVSYDYNRSRGYPFTPDFSTQYWFGDNPDLTAPGTVMTSVNGSPLNWAENGLDIGLYTVRIRDNNTGCETDSTVVLDDGRTPPTIVIVEDNPNQNCEPVAPNGQLAATADGGKVGGYAFDWYAGATATGTPLQTNNKLVGEAVGEYTVRVTSNLTGCFADLQGTITDGHVVPPIPTPEVVRDNARCVAPFEGRVRATVNGVTVNYYFNWYDGEAVTATPGSTMPDYTKLPDGFYTVTATDAQTGCISPPTTVEVLDKTLTPELEFITQPSFCQDVDPLRGSGSIELTLVPGEAVSDEVIWTSADHTGFAATGAFVPNLFPGTYDVLVRTTKGCEVLGSAEVATEVLGYNLVTNNGDSKNDLFVIDCISLFPNNNVKVFNRAGVLVYEANGYDNQDTVFKGLGERGVYAAGNDLPAGTYFWVVDKRDGSPPKTGYLELVK